MDANPYASPKSSPDLSTEASNATEGSVAWLPMMGIAAGAAIGATTNAVNAMICSNYFVRVLNLNDNDAVFGRIIVQGIAEGVGCGFMLGLLLCVAISIISFGRCTLRIATRYFYGICISVVVLWGVGGAAGCVWASIDSASFLACFPSAPVKNTLLFAWVGGSIWGAQLGGGVATIVTCIVATFQRPWASLDRKQQP